MNIAVCIKQTPDTTTRVQVADDGASFVEDDSIQWVINPHDGPAIEKALQLTEEHGGEVTLLSLGPPRLEKTIREGLAMGAHKAIRLHAERIPDDPMATARALAAVLQDGDYDLIFTGRQAVDDDNLMVPGILAQALGLPCVTAIDDLTIDGDAGIALREIEGGHERVRFPLPAIVGTNLRMNEPRYPSFKGIMQAKRKPIDVVDAQLGDEQLVVQKLSYPPEKSAGKVFDNGVDAVPEVVRLLREEARII